MQGWRLSVLLITFVAGQYYNGLDCSTENWKEHMPNFVRDVEKDREQRAKLKLYGGRNASEKKFNWVVQISEIGYKQGFIVTIIIKYFWF